MCKTNPPGGKTAGQKATQQRQKKLNDLNQHFGHAVETDRVLVICPIQSSPLWGAHLPQLIKIEVCEPCLPLAARSFRLAVPREPGKYCTQHGSNLLRHVQRILFLNEQCSKPFCLAFCRRLLRVGSCEPSAET